MRAVESALLIDQWVVEYGSTIRKTLASVGISNVADQAELQQEVFLAAYLALQRGEKIEKPVAWLKAYAWRMAANHRNKATRRRESTRADERSGEASVGNEKIPSRSPSPEQVAQDRERLSLAWERLDKESRSLVFDVDGEGMSWRDVAAARGLTIEQARHIYNKAVKQIEVTLARAELGKTKRRSIPVPVLLKQLFSSLRLEPDDVCPELDHEVREGLARRLEGAMSSALAPDAEPASSVRPSVVFISTPRRPLVAAMSWGAVLGLLGGAAALWLLLSRGFQGTLPARSRVDSSRVCSLVARVPREPRDRTPNVQVSAPLVHVTGSKAVPEKPTAQGPRRPKIITTALPSPGVTSTPELSVVLLDRARTAFQSGDASRALDLLEEHARRFPGELGAEASRRRLQLICAAPAARGAPQCANSAIAIVSEQSPP